MLNLFVADYRTTSGKTVTTQKRTALALPDDKLALFAFVAFDAGWFGRRGWRQGVAFFVQLENGFAFGIVSTAEEPTEPSCLIDHITLAVRTFVLADFFFYNFSFPVTGTCEGAFRIGRAAQKPAVLAEAVHHRRAAFRACIFAWRGFGLGVLHLLGCFFKAFLEGSIKLF